MSDLTDRERMLALLREAGSAGVHTHDLRRGGVSGNPSQRATDLEELHGCRIKRERENRGKRPGARYTLLHEPAGVGDSSMGVAARTTLGRPDNRDWRASDPSGTAPARSARALGPPASRARASSSRTELVWSFVPVEARCWRRTDCPPLRLDSMPTVDDALAQPSLLEAA